MKEEASSEASSEVLKELLPELSRDGFIFTSQLYEKLSIERGWDVSIPAALSQYMCRVQTTSSKILIYTQREIASETSLLYGTYPQGLGGSYMCVYIYIYMETSMSSLSNSSVCDWPRNSEFNNSKKRKRWKGTEI